MVDDFKEMLGGRQSVYDTVPLERLRVDIFRLLGKLESSPQKPHSSFAKECAVDSAVITKQQLKEASRMLQSLEKRSNRIGDSDELKSEYLEDLRIFNTRYVKLTNNFQNEESEGGEDEGCQAGESIANGGIDITGQSASSRPNSPPIDKDAFITKLIEKKKKRSLKGHVGLAAKTGLESSGRGKEKLTALDEIRQFRDHLRSYSSMNGSCNNNEPTKEADLEAFREAQIEQILDAARVLKEQALESKDKVSTSKTSLESFSENIDEMVDRTGKLNKKTKASLSATWDILKLQMYILFFSVGVVVAMFFVIRIFPKQF